MSPESLPALTRIAVCAVAAFVCLEGLLVALWPARVKAWLQEADPRSLRAVAVFEFLLGIGVFMLLAWG